MHLHIFTGCGVSEGIIEKSIKTFGKTFGESIAVSFFSSIIAYEKGKEKDKFEKSINNGSINENNSELCGSIVSYVNLNELLDKKGYIYLYNSYDDKFNYKIKASFDKSINELYIYPPVGNKVYNSIYKFGNYVNENII